MTLPPGHLQHCPVCAYVLTEDDPDHPARCPNCDRPLFDVTAYRARRLLGFILGVLTQLLLGVLAWYFPPGASAGSWALYIALGIFGVFQIVWGAQGWRHAQDEDELAVTAKFEPDDIPYHAKICPSCHHGIAAAIEKGLRRCPECDEHFSLRDLGWREADPHGEPAKLSPHENRLSGPVLVGFIIVFFVLILIVFSIMRLGQSGGTPPLPSPPTGATAPTP